MSAEEIFNMFFGGGFPSSTIYVRRNNQNRYRNARQQESNTSQEEPNFYGLFIQLMPVLLLFILSVMSSYLTPDPAFSLVRTRYVLTFFNFNFYVYELKYLISFSSLKLVNIFMKEKHTISI